MGLDGDGDGGGGGEEEGGGGEGRLEVKIVADRCMRLAP